MRIIHYPVLKTSYYAELWSKDRIIGHAWYGGILTSEDKGDIHKIGATKKIDIIDPCFLNWEGTLPDGTRTIDLMAAENLDAPPPNSYPIRPGVNLVIFLEDEPAPPDPEPDEPLPPMPPDTEYEILRLTIFVPKGSPPMLVRPRDLYVKTDIQIIQCDPEWYEEKFGNLDG